LVSNFFSEKKVFQIEKSNKNTTSCKTSSYYRAALVVQTPLFFVFSRKIDTTIILFINQRFSAHSSLTGFRYFAVTRLKFLLKFKHWVILTINSIILLSRCFGNIEPPFLRLSFAIDTIIFIKGSLHILL